jgi:hypothetical protein
MAKTEIRAVEMVRKIRDKHALLLAGKSKEEILAFYHDAERRFREGLERTRANKAAGAKKRRPARKRK